MKKSALLATPLIFLIHLFCFAQDQPVTGRITGADNSPLANVAIQVKGSSTGTVTNEKGEFSIRVPAKGTLVISSIGYKTKEVAVRGRTTVIEMLETDSKQLDDVVVVGYQSISRKNVTTSIASVGAKDIEPYNTGTVANAIQGKMPGVQVLASSGSVGSQPRIIVRGISSISYNNHPLVVVDGMEVGYNFMSTINPMDIQSIDVLKDASAASIYGARSGQGVILITTKKGRGKPVINFQSSVGITKSRTVKVADAQEFAAFMNKIADNAGQVKPFGRPDTLKNTDYLDATLQDGMRQNYNLSISGGREGITLFGSIGYYEEKSVYGKQGGHWKKITGRLNADMDLGKFIKVGMNLAPRYEVYPYAPLDLTFNAFSMDPTMKPFRTEQELFASIPPLTGPLADLMTAFNPYYSLPSYSPFNGQINPQYNLRANFDKREYWGGLASTYIEVRPIRNLLIKGVVDASANFNQNNNYVPKYFFANNVYNAKTQLSSSTSVNSRIKLTGTAEYTLGIGKHNINALAGASYDDYAEKSTSAGRENIPFDEEQYRVLGAANQLISGSAGYQQGAAPFGRMQSFFGSLRYNFNEKYYVTGTMRADATSLVNPDYRWGYFPSVSAAWVVSNENFFEPLAKTVNYFKLRASWGKSGGNIPNYVGAYLSNVGQSNQVDANGNPIFGYTPTTIANREIRWEVQNDLTLAFDASFLNNKVNVTFERYTRKSDNLLLNVFIDPILGYPQGNPYAFQLSNVGQLTTNGWDLSLGYKDNFFGKLRFGADLTLTHFKSIVDKLSNSDPIITGETNDLITTSRARTTVGHSPGVWWGYIMDGVFQTDEQAASWVNKDGVRLQPAAKAGDLQFRDVNNDGVIDSKDMVDLGSPYPKITAGLTITLGYGNFDFRTELYGAFGQINFNRYRQNMGLSAASYRYNFLSGFENQYWDGPGSTNNFPKLKRTDLNGNFTKMSNFFLERGDFVKCNLMQVGYTIPSKLVRGLRSLRVFASVQNLFIISGYSGLNPDVPWYSSINYNGSDNYQMPNPRIYLFGVNVTL